jgi:uncharacterized protein (DUF58 family)
MIRPTRRLLLLCLLWLATAAVASIFEGLALLWWLVGGAVATVAIVELWRLRRDVELSAERTMPAVLPVGDWSTIELELRQVAYEDLALRPLTGVQVFDHVNPSMEFENLPQNVEIPGQGFVKISYRVRPLERGDQTLDQVEVMVPSRWRLFERRINLPCQDLVRVLPNFRTTARYALLAIDNHLGQMGIKLTRKRGEGLEFQELRDYREGDSQRQVDWAATARRQKLISRQYQEEKDQQVLFLVDCGRRMRSRPKSVDNGEGNHQLAHFDHVLNAILLLTYVAVRQGDSVGFMTFGGEQRWLPPQKGGAAMNLVLSRVYDLQTTTQPPDYLEASRRLMTLQRRRSLVILITNLRDEDTPELLPALQTLRRRNLVLLASLREIEVREQLDRPVFDFEDALAVSATRHYLEARKKAHEQIVGRGILTLDTEPDQLPHRVVNRYLEIKRSGML